MIGSGLGRIACTNHVVLRACGGSAESGGKAEVSNWPRVTMTCQRHGLGGTRGNDLALILPLEGKVGHGGVVVVVNGREGSRFLLVVMS